MVPPGLLLAGLVRRWWVTLAAGALTTGVVLAGVQVAAMQASDLSDHRGRDLSVRLTGPPRLGQGSTGAWWAAPGRVEAGAGRSTVTVTGRGSPAPGMGDRVTAWMRVGPARQRGQTATVSVVGTPRILVADDPAAGLRRAMRTAAGDGDPGWLLSGLTLGMDEGLSPAARDAMRDSGLSHLTAVSGANCAVLLIVVFYLGGWLRLNRVARTAAAAAVLAGFVVVVGAQPSVLRASFMAGLTLVAALFGGRRAAGHLLQMSAVLLLLIDPWLAFSVGFMLSVAATAGLIVLIDRGPVAATVAAQVATFPILLAIGGSVGLHTVVANVVVTPVAAVVPLVGLAAAVLEFAGVTVAPLVAVGRFLSEFILWVASWQGWPTLPWVPGVPGVVLAAGVTAAVLTLGRRRLVLASAVLVGAVALSADLADGWPPSGWWLVACDVGQGDGFVMRSQGHVVVVDTGPEPDVMDGCLRRLGVRDIDLLVLSHFHADHVGGLPGVLRGRRVGQVWVSPCREPAEQYAANAPALTGLAVSVPVPGQRVQVGGMVLTVVWPERIINAGSVPNNASVSFLAAGEQGSVAFLGDIEPEAQTQILASADVDADVVKVPHHGSAQFLESLPAAVTPGVALVGVGEGNTYGHPSREAIGAWQGVGAVVYTTQDNGDIAVTDGLGVVVRPSTP